MSDITQQVNDLKDKVSENFKEIKDKISVPSALNAQKFEGNVKLTGHSFFDTLVIAITTIIIGLPAVNLLYSIPFKDNIPTIQCFPPNENATYYGNISNANIESLCLYHHTLYAALFPVLVTFFGFGIAVLYFVWRNYNSTKLNLFISLVNEMKFIKNEQTGKYDNKNNIIVKRLTKTFSNDNSIYYTYLFVKCLQAMSSLIALLVTVFLYVYALNRSAFLSAFSDTYNVPTFYCKLDQFDFLNSSLDMQVPCIEFASLTTALLLLIDFVLLFVIFVISIASMFQLYPKELKYRQAAKFAFHTGMSHRLFYSKQFGLRSIGCDLDFMILLLRRTDSGQADTLWDVRTLNEIELLNNDDLMRSNLNHDYQKADQIFRDAIQLTEAEDQDLKWDLHGALGNTKRLKLPQPPNSVQLVIPANSFRAAVIGYSAFAVRRVALYISLDSTSLGIPLALTRVFKCRVYSMNFDPFFKQDTDGNLYQAEMWPHNFSRLTFPQDILSSDIRKATEVSEGIEESEMDDIDFIVIGPMEDRTSHKTMLAKILQLINRKLSRTLCLMLVITPAESYGTTKFFEFTPPDTMHKLNVDVTPSDQRYFKWLPIATPITSPEPEETETTEFLCQRQTDKNKLCTPDGSFTFELYTVICRIDEAQVASKDS